MGKLIVVIAIVAGAAYASHKGWVGEWLGKAGDSAGRAIDSAADSARSTQRSATKIRGADPEEKK